MARCSFDNHIQEILGTLMIGATMIMIHPEGNIDFDYLSKILEKKQVTYMQTVPSLLYSIFTYVEQCNSRNPMKCLRSLCSAGE
jgi:acyl-coenzyme A synthetase/AMP-(fatty) acid ligase